MSYFPVQGANSYVVEFANDLSFSKKVTRGPFYAPFTSSTVSTGNLDISGSFPNAAAGSRIFYRIGARNTLDNPGPIPTAISNGGNYIYSDDNFSFTVTSTPPPAPSSSTETRTPNRKK